MPKKKVEYICEKCGYKTNRKSSYKSHKLRSTSCVKKKNEIKIKNNIIDKENKEDKHLKELLEEYKLKLKSCELKLEENENKLEQERKSKNELITTNKDLTITNKNLSSESKNLRESIKINMTMNNFFIVNSFGKEDLNYIDMKKILNDYKSLAHMVAKQIQLKHFSKHKKNHNLMLMRTIAKTYNKEGIWESKNNIKLFIVNELIKKGIVNIDDYKKNENIIFEDKKEKKYKKDKKYLSKNIPLPCMFNPIEAKKRLKEIQEQRKVDIDPKDTLWDNIEKKYKKEIKIAQKQLDVKNALIGDLNKAIKKKEIKANMVTFKN